jgi:hypothetical protein
MAIAADGWNPATLKMEQLNDKDVGPVLEETDWTMPGLERQS